MDRVQPFIEECLFTKCFDNPKKPIDENRLTQTLFLMPTDGKVAASLRKKKNSKLLHSSHDARVPELKQPNYKAVNKNSRIILREYFNKCRLATDRSHKLSHKLGISDRVQFENYLKEKHSDLWEDLPKYCTFSQMYDNMWCPYMKELLNLPSNHTPGSSLSLNSQQVLLKLSMADYNGCKLRVVKSKNKSLIGIEGIVIWDAQKSFIMVSPGKLCDNIKSIPKKGSLFEFQIPLNDEESLSYSILGDRFKYRSIDRAGRKFKNRRCDDLLYYIR